MKMFLLSLQVSEEATYECLLSFLSGSFSLDTKLTMKVFHALLVVRSSIQFSSPMDLCVRLKQDRSKGAFTNMLLFKENVICIWKRAFDVITVREHETSSYISTV